MYTNADITLYLCKKEGIKKIYTRLHIHNVFRDEIEGALLLKTGQRNTATVQLIIPYESLEGKISFNPMDDLVINGIVDDEIDSSTEKALSDSITALKTKYKLRTVMTAEPKLYGSEEMWHYELLCK